VAEKLILVRHGQSELGARGLVNGDPSVTCPLTAAGVRQSEALARALEPLAIDLCVTSAFTRTRATAEIILSGRSIPLEVWPDLGDPPLGRFESRALGDYLAWRENNDWSEGPHGGGESQLASVRRYTSVYTKLVDRPEPIILVVCHAFPIAFALAALDDHGPAVRARYAVEVDHATQYVAAAAKLRSGLERARRELRLIDRGARAGPPRY
jgi:broad specificity phosphatase PhoE